MKKLILIASAIALMGQGCLIPGRITTQPPIAKPEPAPTPMLNPTPRPTPSPSPMPYNY